MAWWQIARAISGSRRVSRRISASSIREQARYANTLCRTRVRTPHTPVFDQKGMLWFTVQRGNSVGRLDPQNGLIVLKNVPTAHALPYGIAVNSKGVPYFCEFGTNKLARSDPRTMDITEYPLPDGARPRRLAITSNDMVYYSDYARG